MISETDVGIPLRNAFQYALSKYLLKHVNKHMLNKILLIVILLINVAILGILYTTNPTVISDAFGSGGDDSAGLAKNKTEGGNNATAEANPGQENNMVPPDTSAPLAGPDNNKTDGSQLDDKKNETEKKAAENKSTENPGQSTPNPTESSPPGHSEGGLGAKPNSALYEEFPGVYDSRLTSGVSKVDSN
ncbi:hypothetical protein PAEPH01_0177 [Pancytospora epiphaga]|nr:hypothetical protein PAEPH01_0177 [Pancytospora epiphaga]